MLVMNNNALVQQSLWVKNDFFFLSLSRFKLFSAVTIVIKKKKKRLNINYVNYVSLPNGNKPKWRTDIGIIDDDGYFQIDWTL